MFDTTLRDGEQVPGAKLNLYEKLEVAQQLKKLKVDIIEAGFPSSSAGDFNAVKEIAIKIGNTDETIITALARAVKTDIDAVYNSVKYAEKPLVNPYSFRRFRHSRGKEVWKIEKSNLRSWC